jgi:predicted cobalt transporter CbtA
VRSGSSRPGFNLAFWGLAGYAALSIADLFAVRQRDAPHTPAAVFAE